MAAAWDEIRAEYLAGGVSIRALAEKHGISESTLKKRAIREKWNKDRSKIRTQSVQKSIARAIERKADQYDKIMHANDTLTEVCDQLIEKLLADPYALTGDLRGTESVAKAVYQVLVTKRELMRVPDVGRELQHQEQMERIRLEREKWEADQAEKKAQEAAVGSTMWTVKAPEGEPLDE